MDGAVYEWNISSFKRVGECILKSCSYTSVSLSPDSRTVYAVGSDKTMKEIYDGQVCHLDIIWLSFKDFIGNELSTKI